MKKIIVFRHLMTVATTIAISQVSFADNSSSSDYSGSGKVTQGEATAITSNLFECQSGHSRIARIGGIKDSEGTVWTVPAVNHFTSAPHATDLYEECSGITPKNLSAVDLNAVPTVEIDSDGEVITGYIFADNYFELYINGRLVGVDSVPFTPFNSSVVKFKVKKPYTIAVKVVDWEENLGIGSESNRGTPYHAGDGGFIASFSDGTVTNSDWKAQTFYTSPILDLSCLSEVDHKRLSNTCSTEGKQDNKNAYAIHWSVPSDWMKTSFDTSHWPNASTYTERTIGVDNKKSYMNFRKQFTGSGAHFIWSSNLILDNEVLLIYTVK